MRTKGIGLGLSLALAIGAAGCAGLDTGSLTEAAGGAYQAYALSDDQVKELASQARAEMDGQNTVAGASDPYSQRLRKLVGAHPEVNGTPLDFQVYLTDDVNAFAMADGTVRVYRGLMDLMSDDELRFVIGHEIGHVALGHSRESMQVAYGTFALRKGVSAAGGTVGMLAQSQVGDFAEKLVHARFSQSDELEADGWSLGFLKEHGYPQEPAVTALRKLGGGGGSFLSSHPDSETRAEKIEARLAGGS
ncbi:MAG: M48 family metallopeptidase [Myxococcota bacterium]